MTIKEFEKVLNEKLVEFKIKHNYPLLKGVMEHAVKNLVESTLDTEKYDVHYGSRWYPGQNRNRLYISAKYANSSNWDKSFVEIQIHKTLQYTDSIGGNWNIVKLTAKAFGKKEVTFEEAYNNYVSAWEEIKRQHAEEKEKARIEKERIKKEQLKNFNIAKTEVLNYIKEHNLNIKEFDEIAHTYYTYNHNYIDGQLYTIFDD